MSIYVNAKKVIDFTCLDMPAISPSKTWIFMLHRLTLCTTQCNYLCLFLLRQYVFWRYSEGWPNEPRSAPLANYSQLTAGRCGIPVAVVDLRVRAKQFLLSRLICKVSSHLVSVFFRLQRGDKMYPRPHLLACEFAVPCQHSPSISSPTISSLMVSAEVYTYLCSRIPCPTLQNPYVISAAVPTMYAAGRKPRAGRLRLY